MPSVAQSEQRAFLALEVLLDHDQVGVEAPLHEQLLKCRAGLWLIGDDHHALARRQTVGLDHRRVAFDRAQRGVGLARHDVGGRGHAGGGHHLLAERLRALQTSRCCRRAEAADARCGERRRSRRRPAAASGPTTTKSICSARVAATIVVVRRSEQASLGGDAGVARGAQQLGLLGRARERLHERVLASPAAEHEDALAPAPRPSLAVRSSQ